jgi:hypothetical protein
MVKVVGIYSALPRSGKSTAAAALSGLGWKRVPFAATLKRMLRRLLLDLGMDDREVEWALNDGKEEPLELLPQRTPRQLLQTLGTEWGRGMADPELWVRCWQAQAREALAAGWSVVADDVRRVNEAQAVRDTGGVIVKVVRPDGGSERFSNHASEGALEDWPFDAVLVNDGTAAELQRQVLALLEATPQQED